MPSFNQTTSNKCLECFWMFRFTSVYLDVYVYLSRAQMSLQSLAYRIRGKILLCDIMRSCDRHDEIPFCIVNTVVELVEVYGERWLTWLLEVCNHDLPVPLLALVEQLNSQSSWFGSYTMRAL